MALTSGKTFNRRHWSEPVPDGVNPILESFRDHERHGNDPEDTNLTPLEEWLHWMEWGDQEVTEDPAAIAQATRVFHLLAIYRGVR